MPNQVTMNNHFIPRCLTKPWEDHQRMLKLYSFETRSFEKKPSKTSFSATGVYPQELETFLNQYVESPINDLRRRLERGEDVLNEPRFHRAAVLLTILQRRRNKAATETKWLDELLLLLKKPKEFLDGLQTEQGYGLICAQSTEGSRPIWFPSSGSFYLLGKSLSWEGQRLHPPLAIPLDRQRALILYRLGLDVDQSTKNGIRAVVSTYAPQLIEDASAGTDTATRVIIPPTLAKSEEDLAVMLQHARKKNMAAIAEHNQAVSTSSSHFGEL